MWCSDVLKALNTSCISDRNLYYDVIAFSIVPVLLALVIFVVYKVMVARAATHVRGMLLLVNSAVPPCAHTPVVRPSGQAV